MLTDTIKRDSSVGGASCVLLGLFTAALLFFMGLQDGATNGGGAGHTALLSNHDQWSAQWWTARVIHWRRWGPDLLCCYQIVTTYLRNQGLQDRATDGNGAGPTVLISNRDHLSAQWGTAREIHWRRWGLDLLCCYQIVTTYLRNQGLQNRATNRCGAGPTVLLSNRDHWSAQ